MCTTSNNNIEIAKNLYDFLTEKYYAEFIVQASTRFETNQLYYMFIDFFNHNDWKSWTIDFHIDTDNEGRKTIKYVDKSDALELFMGNIIDVNLIYEDWDKYLTNTPIFENYTPHDIKLNNGVVFESKGVARIKNTQTHVGGLLYESTFDGFEGLPEPRKGVLYIVSLPMLMEAKKAGLTYLVAPNTGSEECVRNEKGHVVSVPGFIR